MITTILILIVALPLFLLAVGQMGLLRGQMPTDLGVKQGRLKGLSATPNAVSSQAALYPDARQAQYAAIEPLPLKSGDPIQSMATLGSLVQAMAGAKVIEQRPDYIYAQAETPWLKFTDDMEFWFNPANQMIEMRSASRLGKLDFATNRKRLEAIRTAYAVAS